MGLGVLKGVNHGDPLLFDQFKRLGVSYGEAVEEAPGDGVLQEVRA